MLSDAACQRAFQSRDARFDGRFFVAVRTTGIYCRPICPAPRPRRRNVRFFPTAAAAEAGGFRPCRRCRPETAPESPEWRGSSETVARALRWIAAGALDGVGAGGVDDVAARCGVGARQLRRLFLEHLGASPGRVARTRRLHFARRLLDDSDLPVTEVAFAAGFGSVRRFNAAFRETFRATPTALRRRPSGSRRTPLAAAAGSVSLRVPYRPPYDWGALLAFLGARAIPGVERVDGDGYQRTIATAEGSALLSVAPAPSGAALVVRLVHGEVHQLLDVVEGVRRLFDLAVEPSEVAAVLGRDPDLGRRVRAAPGLRIPGAWDGFEMAVRAILGQQVSVAAATTLAGRLAARHGRSVDVAAPGLEHCFPDAETLAPLASADLMTIGLTSRRAASIVALARSVAAGELVLDGSDDPRRVRERLLALPGVGPWTVEVVALRALGDPDAFPEGDLGLRHALAGGDASGSASRLRARAERWRPWRGYAVLHLWHSLDQKGADDGR